MEAKGRRWARKQTGLQREGEREGTPAKCPLFHPQKLKQGHHLRVRGGKGKGERSEGHAGGVKGSLSRVGE